MGVAIIGSGYYLPGNAVSNQELIDRFGYETTAEKITKVTGIESRNIASADETLANISSKAARIAFASAGIAAPERFQADQLLIASSTPDRVFPNTAAEVTKILFKGENTSSFDGNAACAGFAKILEIAGNNTNGKPTKRSLLIGADILSRITNYSDYITGTLFADGAGAMILENTDTDQGLIWSASKTLYDEDILHCPLPSESAEDVHPFIHMNGRAVMRLVNEKLPENIDELLAGAGIGINKVSKFIFHQANGRMLKGLADELGVDEEQVPAHGVRCTGNTSAATIPIAYAMEFASGNIKRGDLVVFSGFGSGMCIESVLWEI